MPTFWNTLFHLHRRVGVCRMNWVREMLVYHRERVWLEISLAISELGDRVGTGQVQKQVLGGNDPHRGHELVCEGEW
jgi:hypothetical protein